MTAENLRFVKSIPFQLFIGMTFILLVSFLTRLINTRVQRKKNINVRPIVKVGVIFLCGIFPMFTTKDPTNVTL